MSEFSVPNAALAPPHTSLTASRNASPCRSPSNHSSPSGTRRVLAKDRREDGEKAQELLEALQDKERRVQQQLDRCAEERGRKMEEQRRKEQKRRAAAEEKRRQQQEAEKERLEALVRKRAGGNERRAGGGGESRETLENRPKRWTWGGPPDGAEGNPQTPPCPAIGSAPPTEPPAASCPRPSCNAGDFLSPPAMEPAASKELSSSSSAIHSSERASANNHKSQRSSSKRRSTAGLAEETCSAKTPTGEFPNPPARSSSFRSNSKGPATPKRVRSARSPAQSPCSPGQYPPSPLRQRAPTPGVEDRGHAEVKGHSSLERRSKSEAAERKMPKSSSRELTADSPGTAAGRSLAGTTDAEEASRLLAERRRLARIQKEQEERQRQEEERLRAEEEQRRLQEAKERQERAAQQAEEERARQEEERRNREDEERRQKEQRWKDMQDQLDKEREEAFLRAQREAEKKRQERELLHLQEEQERLQRKKRIEEIMKRTRRSDAEPQAAVPDARTSLTAPSEEDARSPAEAPTITLGSLETKSCLDELSDGVQSMDVSPVSREEQASAQEFSPVTEEQVMDLDAHGRASTQTPSYPKVQASSGVGDLNKNLLIQACSAQSSESSQLMCSVGPSKLDVQ